MASVGLTDRVDPERPARLVRAPASRLDVVLMAWKRGDIGDATLEAAERLRTAYAMSQGSSGGSPSPDSPRSSGAPAAGWPTHTRVKALGEVRDALAALGPQDGLEVVTVRYIVLEYGSARQLAALRRLRQTTVSLALRRALNRLADYYADEQTSQRTAGPFQGLNS